MKDYLVEVCDACRTAACWHGDAMCEAARQAGTVKVRASHLRKENNEHPSNYSREHLRSVTGDFPEVV